MRILCCLTKGAIAPSCNCVVGLQLVQRQTDPDYRLNITHDCLAIEDIQMGEGRWVIADLVAREERSGPWEWTSVAIGEKEKLKLAADALLAPIPAPHTSA